MNVVEFKIRLHHPSASHKILTRWFQIFYMELIGEDDVYHVKFSIEQIEKTKVIIVNIYFQTPMVFEEMVEFMNYFTEFEKASIYTIYNSPVNVELLDDKIFYNKELFYLQDLTIRNSKTKERLSELKHSWNQV